MNNNQCSGAGDNPIIASLASSPKAFTTKFMKSTAHCLCESCGTHSMVLLTGWLDCIAVE